MIVLKIVLDIEILYLEPVYFFIGLNLKFSNFLGLPIQNTGQPNFFSDCLKKLADLKGNFGGFEA